MNITIGKTAPDFALSSQNGRTVRLGDYRGKKNLVLYFYLSDSNPVCALEARSFSAMYDAFRDAGAEIIGVSGDSPGSHAEFAAENRVAFPLLSDTKNGIRKQYGVPSILGLISVRVTLVIDRQGVVRSIIYSQLKVQRHVEEAFEAVEKIEKENKPHLELVS